MKFSKHNKIALSTFTITLLIFFYFFEATSSIIDWSTKSKVLFLSLEAAAIAIVYFFKEYFDKNWKHVVITCLFMLVSLAYCYPVKDGKQLNQNDDLSAKALNIEAEKYHEKTGEFIGWTNSMFSGMPTSVGYSGPSNYSILLIYGLAKASDGFSFDVIFWSLIGMYILFCILGINPWLGALGSFIFAFSSFNILSLEAGHVQKMFNISFVPLLLGGIFLIFQKRYVWGFIAVAFGVNYQVGLAHYQITYYAAIAAVVVCIYYGIKWLIDKEFKALGIAVGLLLLASILGTLPNLTMLNTYYASKVTTRGGASELTEQENKNEGNTNANNNTDNKDGLDYGYATAWSYSVPETFTLLVPNAYGGDGKPLALKKVKNQYSYNEKSESFKAIRQNIQDPNQMQQAAYQTTAYWGEQPFVGGPIYFGAIVCFLAIFGVIASSRKEKWWVLVFTVLFLFLAWGNHSFVYRVFFDYMPVFNKFRTPSMALSIVQIGFSVLAILGLVEIFRAGDKDKARLYKLLLYTGAGVGGLLFIMAFMPSVLFSFEKSVGNEANLPEWLISAMVDDRAALMKADALRSLGFVAVAFALLWIYLKGIFSNVNYILIGVALFIVIDLWNFNLRYLDKDKFVTKREKKNPIAATQADSRILQDQDPHFRVLNLLPSNPFSDYSTSYFHHSIGGYHGAKLRKYQELIERQINFRNPSVLSMLNTKYVIFNAGQQGAMAVAPDKSPMGNAWFVNNVKVVENADQEMAALTVDSVSSFEPANDLVVQKKNLPQELKGFQPKQDPTASIQLVEYAPHKLKYKSKASSDQVAVFSEIFYELEDGDGWKAFIDNEPADHFLANYVLRAMKVPAGEHTIEFKFDASQSLGRVRNSFFFFVLLILVSIGAVYLKHKGKLKWEGQPEPTLPKQEKED